MPIYLCNDGNAEVEIAAESAREAAQAYVDEGGCGEITKTVWITVGVHEVTERETEWERITIAVNPEKPECREDGEHDWHSPYDVLGGLREDPGVWGHGGGVLIRELCANCGRYRIRDTWAQNPENGEQGLKSVEYQEPDKESRAWLLRRLIGAAEAVPTPDKYTAHCDLDLGHLYLERDEDCERVELTEPEMREVVESRSWDAIVEQMPVSDEP